MLKRQDVDSDGPTIAVLYYRAQQLAGNTAYVEALCQAIERAGGRALPVYCASLRTAESALLDTLAAADAMVVTVLAAGGVKPAAASAGEDDSWNVEHLAALDVPILQGLCLTSSRAQWSDNDDGLSPLDVATQVAVPEFDGRIITVPFSFKEIDDDGLISYVADPERCDRVAGLAVRHALLRRIGPADKRVALVFSAYPTKHARIGNAVGLTPRPVRSPCYGPCGTPATRWGSARCRGRRRRRADPRPDRARRTRPRLAHLGAVGRQPDPGVGGRLPQVVRHAAR